VEFCAESNGPVHGRRKVAQLDKELILDADADLLRFFSGISERCTVGTGLKQYSNNIGTEGAKVIGEALKVNTLLTYIGLNGNNIGAEGGKAIGEALKVNTSLTEILLQRNNIGDEGARLSERH
jgi:hypothetical protein